MTAIAEDSVVRLITQSEILASAGDIDGDGLVATGLAVNTGNGSLTDNGDGTWVYTPAADDDTDVSFTYTITDGADNVAGSATLEITPVNDSPTTTPVILTAIAEDSVVRLITQSELLASADDIDGDGLTATGLAINTGNGSLTDNGDGTWVYTPAADDDTDVSFTYTITDGVESVAGTATLDITPVNDPPTAAPVTLTAIVEDSVTRLITQSELLANAGDSDGDGLTAIGLSVNTGNGSLTDNADGTWSYTPAADDDADVSFTYIITDGVDNVSGAAGLDITPVNDPPTNAPVTLSTILEGSGTRLITQSELLASADDIDGDGLTATGLAINTGNGSLTENGDGTWVYTPAADDDTDVSFTYTITDGVESVAGTATLDITPVNDPPTTTPVTINAISEDSVARLITQSELLANAGDSDGDGLTASGLAVSSGNGSLTDNGDGTWSYTPAADDDTDVSFVYTIADGVENVAGTATLDITPVNDPPTTPTVTLTAVAEDSGIRLITQAELLANANDIEGDGLTAVGLTLSAGDGTLTDNGEGTWSYTPADNDDTDASFAYSLTDGTDSTIGFATLDISPVNDAPTTAPITLDSVAEDSGVRLITQAQLLANANDIEGEGLTATGLIVNSGNGTLIDNGDGTWRYTPAANDDTNVSFAYTVSDGAGSVAGSASLDITPVNDTPEGSDTTVQTPEDTPYVLRVSDFPFSDVLDGDEFSGIYITSLPVGGALTLSGNPVMATDFIDARQIEDGALVFTPSLNYVSSGDDSLEYLLRDSGGTLNGGVDVDPEIRQINFVVNAVNDAPQIITNVVTVDEGGERLIDNGFLSGIDVDDLLPEDLTYTLQTLPGNGELSLAGVILAAGDKFTVAELMTGQLRYKHDGSETTSDFVDLALADGGEDGVAAALGQLSFSIREVIDQAPVVEDDQLVLEYGKPFRSAEGDLLVSGFATLSGNLLQEQSGIVLTIENPPEHGTLDIDPEGHITYIHNESSVLQDEFTYRLTNEDGVFSLATVKILVEPPITAAIDGFAPVDIPDADADADTDADTESAVVVTPTESVEKLEQQVDLDPDAFTPDASSTAAAEAESGEQQTSIVIDVPVVFQNDGQTRIGLEDDDIGVREHNPQKKSTVDSVELTADNSYLEFVFENNLSGVSRSDSPDVQTRLHFDFDKTDNETDAPNNAIGAKEVVFGLSFSATAGFVVWVLRGGVLLASLAASTPLWASIDPVRVFNREFDDDTSDEVENLFDNKKHPKGESEDRAA